MRGMLRLMIVVLLGMSPISLGIQICGASETTTIVFLTWKPNQPHVWNRLIKRFQQENPKIRVRVQVGPHSSTQYHAIVTQRLKNKDPSLDVFFMDVTWPPEFASAGWVADLTPKFPPAEQKKFLKGPITANTYKGKIYGVPCYLGAGLLYYRKDLLTKYGLRPPTHWQEMLSQGAKIVQAESDPDLHIYSAQFKQYEGLVCNMLEFIWSNGGQVLDRKSRQVCLDEPSSIRAIAFVRDKIIGKAAPQGVINYEEPESLDIFVQGKAVFHRNWPYAWAVANSTKESNIAGKVGVCPLPSFHGHSSASTLGGWQFAINRYSKHFRESWRFIEFMTSHETQRLLALEAGLAPTRCSVYTDPLVLARMPHLKAFLPAFQKARPRPLSPVYPMISQELQRFFSRSIIDKESDISKMAKETYKKIERLLKLEDMIGK